MDKGKLTVLFIRDDSTVRRFRIRPFWVKLAFYVFLFTLLLALASSYGVYSLWNKYTQLRENHNQLEMAHHEAEVNLERLQNMEKLRGARINADPALNQTAPPAAEARIRTSPAPEPRKNTENELAALYPPLDKDIIEVNNLAAKTVDNDFHVTFDIKNVDESDAPISGRVNLALITWQGEKLPLEVNRSNLSFRIQWFKSMKTTFPLPDGEDLKDVYALRITVTTSAGEAILQETHPLSQLLSRPGAGG